MTTDRVPVTAADRPSVTDNARAEILPTLPGYVNGIVGRSPWRVRCQECGGISEHEHLILAIRAREMVFHPWDDGTNPRLCSACRLARGCTCHRCAEERNKARWSR